MIDHVTLRVTDLDAVRPAYDAVLSTLGIARNLDDPTLPEWRDFSLQQTDAEHPVTTGAHVGFVAPDRAAVDAFHAAGLAAGWRDAGPPGPRPQYLPDYYGAFLLDPDGTSVEAVHHARRRTDGHVDHVWLRVGDLAATRAFYTAFLEPAGLTVGIDAPDHLLLRAGGGSVSFVPGERPSAHVHLAFSSSGGEPAVDAFHAAALAAGGVDHGPPGRRPIYHPGYYGAFVLDPDGHNVEVVHHDR